MSGYDQFFKQARKAQSTVGSSSVRSKPQISRPSIEKTMTVKDLERQLQVSKKRKKPVKVSWKLAGFSLIGLVLMLWGFQNIEVVEKYAKKIEIDFLGHASAETATSTDTTQANKESAAKAVTTEDKQTSAEPVASVEHLSKLNQRKKELDAKEEELNRMEAELQAQKVELENKIAELDKMRRSISSVLEEKIQKDNQKIDELVQMYTSMKPPQAAKVLESMDENLVVEILGKMKKKNAAEIMNLLKPEKAQSISEKYAGYKMK